MRSVYDPNLRMDLVRRLRSLDPTATPRWGKMDVSQMLCHVGDQMRVALGDLESKPTPIFLRFWLPRMLFVHLLPWPKGVPTAPEMLTSRPTNWTQDVGAVVTLLERFSGLASRVDWPEHPAFGKLSSREWGWLVYRHTDHHLTQFGA